MKKYKNWQRIAALNVTRMRNAFIMAKGREERDLQERFPGYFSDDPVKPSRSQLRKLVRSVNCRETVLDILRNADIPLECRGFVGDWDGTLTHGFPFSKGQYQPGPTHPRQIFCRSMMQQGDEMKYRGGRWMIVWNSYSHESSTPAESVWIHSVIAVPLGKLHC